nr:beta-L-arabinofuranosidase domain-containing protein [uncultured Clostridium sp.]
MTNKEIVTKDLESIYLGNLKTVEFDLKLPTKGINGSDIRWESGHDRIITPEGKVFRPTFGKGTREVPLTATLRYGEAVLQKTYLVTVLEEENNIKVKKVYPVERCIEVGKDFYLPGVTVIETESGKIIAHVVDWGNSGRIIPNKTGDLQVTGFIKGTEIPVTAKLHAVEKLDQNLADPSPVLHAFTGGEVLLIGDSPYLEAQERVKTFLLSVNDDQMLANFRRAAGLDTLGAPEMIGWDAPDGLLRGHTTGHYLSALALCYRASGDEVIRKKAEYMVNALEECQNAFAKLPGYHPGFLSAYSEEQFDLLEVYTPYPKIWAPYYTLHKIIAGLLDCSQIAGVRKALGIADKIGDWVYQRLSGLSHEQRTKMWGMYIAGEFGGMNDVLSQLYMLTGKKKYLEAAKLFDNDRLFYPMEERIDALDELHANQHIPQAIGAMRIFEASGDRHYYDIASFFWNSVTKSHIYAIGGTGEGEMFHAPNRIAGLLSKNTAETCASYNMLKLTKELYCYSPDSSYMDYYERTMVNHILSSGDCEPNGATTYFMPLAPGFKKEFDEENSCCHGTGLENHFRYVESIYYSEKDTMYVNLFLPSSVNWDQKQVKLIQCVKENCPGEITLKVQGNADFTLKIRVPYWSAGSFSVRINEKAEKIKEENGYLVLHRQWKDQDIVEVKYSSMLRVETSPDDDSIVSLAYGPYVLAALTDSKDFISLNLNGTPVEAQFIQKVGTLMFQLKDSNIWFKPLYQIHYETYQVYVNRG